MLCLASRYLVGRRLSRTLRSRSDTPLEYVVSRRGDSPLLTERFRCPAAGVLAFAATPTATPATMPNSSALTVVDIACASGVRCVPRAALAGEQGERLRVGTARSDDEMRQQDLQNSHGGVKSDNDRLT